MIDLELLELLECPENRTRLSLAADDVIQQLNAKIAAGTLLNRVGRPVQTAIQGGLIRQDGTLLYPIIDGIPMVLIDEAIPLAQLAEQG